MVMSVNTNVLSLTAQRNMMDTQSALSNSIQRLSTGLRINSAKAAWIRPMRNREPARIFVLPNLNPAKG